VQFFKKCMFFCLSCRWGLTVYMYVFSSLYIQRELTPWYTVFFKYCTEHLFRNERKMKGVVMRLWTQQGTCLNELFFIYISILNPPDWYCWENGWEQDWYDLDWFKRSLERYFNLAQTGTKLDLRPIFV